MSKHTTVVKMMSTNKIQCMKTQLELNPDRPQKLLESNGIHHLCFVLDRKKLYLGGLALNAPSQE